MVRRIKGFQGSKVTVHLRGRPAPHACRGFYWASLAPVAPVAPGLARSMLARLDENLTRVLVPDTGARAHPSGRPLQGVLGGIRGACARCKVQAGSRFPRELWRAIPCEWDPVSSEARQAKKGLI